MYTSLLTIVYIRNFESHRQAFDLCPKGMDIGSYPVFPETVWDLYKREVACKVPGPGTSRLLVYARADEGTHRYWASRHTSVNLTVQRCKTKVIKKLLGYFIASKPNLTHTHTHTHTIELAVREASFVGNGEGIESRCDDYYLLLLSFHTSP